MTLALDCFLCVFIKSSFVLKTHPISVAWSNLHIHEDLASERLEKRSMQLMEGAEANWSAATAPGKGPRIGRNSREGCVMRRFA